MSKGRYFCGGSALAVTFALSMGATHAMAQDNGAAFRAADKNSDGKLDAAEFQTLPQGIRDKAVDANGDGFYSLAELTPATGGDKDVTEVRAIVSVGTYLKSGSEDTALNVEATSRDDLLKTGSPAIEDLIRGLSEGGLSLANDANGQGADGYGVRSMNLRNLGSGRTLILFDGIRLADDPQTNGGPAVTRDPNVNGGGSQNLAGVPLEVLQSVEILKDGGSAAYGGDAVGGAVNFAPRRDLNGFEVSVSYKYIANTTGNYDANIQWGKRRGSENFLFSAFYAHTSPLAMKDRDFIARSFLFTQTNLGWGSWDYNFQNWAFGAPGSTNLASPGFTGASTSGAAPGFQFGKSDPLLFTTAGVANLNGATTSTAAGFTLPTQGPFSGQLRDDACLALGGTRNFSQGANQQTAAGNVFNPVCGWAKYLEGNIVEDNDTYRLFTDSTVNLTDNLRFHSSATFSKTQPTIVGAQMQESNACDPWPENAPSYTTATSGTGTIPSRQCFSPGINGSTLAQSQGAFSQPGNNGGPTVPGYNPAVRDYMMRYYANPIGASTNGQRVFSDSAINSVTGCPTGAITAFNCSFVSDAGQANGSLIGRAYTQGNGTITNGIFTPGSTSVAGAYGTTVASVFIPTSTITTGAAFSSVQTPTNASGVAIGQGYGPVNTPTTVIVNISSTTTPSFVAATLGAVSSTSTPGSGLPGSYGRVGLINGAYGPFVAMYNSAFKGGEAFFNSQNVTFSTTQDVKGDLGQHFGMAMDFTVKANYSRNMNRTTGRQAMTDRFQRALNGFGTDLDHLSADHLGCSVAETAGTRVLQTAPGVLTAVTGVPYTVGAGGGGDYNTATAGIQRAELGFNPGLASGNGCYFFNPFDSAIRVSRLNGAKLVATNGDVGFVGASTPSAAGLFDGPGTAVGITGSYQGYGVGTGLENSPGLMRWMFQSRDVRSLSDQILLQGIVNGEFTKWELPGGPVAWVLGTQYRLVSRDAFGSDISNGAINPCPFLRRATGDYSAINNLVNATSTCSGTASTFMNTNTASLATGFNSSPIGGGNQTTINHSVFFELQLPALQKLSLHTIARYEEYKDPAAPSFRGSGIYSADAKWQAFDNLAFVANIGQTFDAPILQNAGFTTTFVKNFSSQTSAYYTGTTAADVNINSQSRLFVNTALGPEHGLSWGAGAIFQSRDRATQIRVQYFNNKVNGSPQAGITASTVGRALTFNRVRGANIDLTQTIDCADPRLQQFFRNDGAGGLFDGAPFVQFTDGTSFYNCGANDGGPTITTFNMTGVDLNSNGSALDASDLGLSINSPNQINGGDLVRSGVEFNANHRVRSMVYGGVLSFNADMTRNLKSQQVDTYAYGTFIQAGVDNIGTLNDGFGVNADIWRGSIGFNYSRGKHNFRMATRWSGSIVDNSGLGLAINGTPYNAGTALNPADQSKCNSVASGLGVPFLPQPVSNKDIAGLLGDILVGEQNGNPNCIYNDLKGYQNRGQTNTSATYQVQLPQDTTLTVTVDNVFNLSPSYQRFLENYNPFGSLGPEGRTVKVGVQKKF